MDERFDHVDNDIRELRTEFGALQRTIIQLGGGMVAAILALVITQL